MHGFYTPVLLMIVSLYVLVKLISGQSPFKVEFLIYVISIQILFIGGISVTASRIFPMAEMVKITEVANLIFSVIETLVFLTFFSKILRANWAQIFLKALKVAVIAGGLIVIGYHLRTSVQMDNVGYYFTTINLSFLIISSLHYFYEIYRHDFDLIPSRTYIVLALFSYAIITIPYFTLAAHINSNAFLIHGFYTIHYLLLSSLCYCLILTNKLGSVS
jgi:hypothetical protein